MRNCESNVIATAIHQWTYVEPMDIVRIERFKKQLEITKAIRGGQPNVALAWYGTSPNGLATILRYGFAFTESSLMELVSTCPLFAHPTQVDVHGEKHVLLCRVTLGNCEITEPGSQQHLPSGNSFVSGVDGVAYPRCYVVCGAIT
ncbi:hypothetical protein Acr_11g0003420 [Actinidia rufa]|uniref:PARP catalytic domain-containing protein n=1 Tax=Actinidia rufa TaxID=165716 RepID=A0A7J0FC81_9ERIC|nr:hypothetical protein Acr_11g0003420 [Actinidia rufa]